MDKTYFLKTARVGFRPWSLEDLSIASELLCDQSTTQYIGGPYSIPKIKRRLLTEAVILRLHHIQYWPVFLLHTNEFIGYCGLRPNKPLERICEIGVCIKPVFWGKGYAEEAAQTIIDYAFQVLDTQAITAVHNPLNVYSKKLLERLHFQYSHEEYSFKTNQYDPSYILLRR